jgi:hypothetical protein
MELNTELVMENFINSIGNLFTVLGFCAIISLVLTGIYIYFVHIRGKDKEGWTG